MLNQSTTLAPRRFGPETRQLHRELTVSLARARQEVRAASLLARRGHSAEGLRLSLRALDSALHASQLKSGLNEPARALTALGIAPELPALDVLRRARSLDVPMLDDDVQDELRELVEDAVTGARRKDG